VGKIHLSKELLTTEGAAVIPFLVCTQTTGKRPYNSAQPGLFGNAEFLVCTRTIGEAAAGCLTTWAWSKVSSITNTKRYHSLPSAYFCLLPSDPGWDQNEFVPQLHTVLVRAMLRA